MTFSSRSFSKARRISCRLFSSPRPAGRSRTWPSGMTISMGTALPAAIRLSAMTFARPMCIQWESLSPLPCSRQGDRIFPLRIRCAPRPAGRSVDVDPPPAAAGGGVVPVDGNRPVRDVAPLVDPRPPPGPGNLDEPPAALAVPEDVGAGRVGQYHAVDVEGVIVDARRQRSNGDGPGSVFPLHKGGRGRLEGRLHLSAVEGNLLGPVGRRAER